jgi:hypothetical protein
LPLQIQRLLKTNTLQLAHQERLTLTNEKQAQLRRQKKGRNMAKQNQGKQECGPYELVVETATAQISFGKFAVHEARLAAAIKAAPLVILEIERWLDLAGTSELHLAKTPNGYE